MVERVTLLVALEEEDEEAGEIPESRRSYGAERSVRRLTLRSRLMGQDLCPSIMSTKISGFSDELL